MKAASYVRRSSGKCLELADIATPVPRKREVLIKTYAASVNPLDWRLKSHHPGVDVAGEIVSVGSAVTRFHRGDKVFGAGRGSFAEYVCASETKLAAKPDNITFEEAASVPVAGLTALQGLRDKGRLERGQKVLINGASGGVGTFAVQIAKAFGADVTGVCSTKNVEMIRSLGADVAVDYTQQDFTRDTKRYDLVLDNVGNRSLAELRRVLAPGGRCVLAGAPKQMGPILLRMLDWIVRSTLLRQKFIFFVAQFRQADMELLGTLMRTGKIHPVIDRRYSLNETGEALAYVEAGHARAKVVVIPE
ncbi:MAG TPA: NAD(P)-dependent alcohol dehydrogenase [Bryobacteraceae bacterium]|nr:NAD(P)-dependent alcohol dehydrogenase [Bryobacteraceae bacterium]